MKLTRSAAHLLPTLAIAAFAGMAATAQTPAQHAGAAQAPSGTQPGVDGAALFETNCAACHQPKGEGIEGAFPALAGNPFVKGDGNAVAATVLNGRGGMPAFRDDLKDDQLAAVVSYVRGSWGNAATPIAAETVAALRSGAKSTIDRPIPAH